MTIESPWADDKDVTIPAGNASLKAAFVLGVVGLASYVLGLTNIATAPGVVLVACGLLAWLLVLIFVAAGTSYRPVSDEDAHRILSAEVFHLTSQLWEENDLVTLAVAHCRHPQFISEGFFPKRAKLVYVFAQRPTRQYARGQSLDGRRRAARHLYTLAVVEVPPRVFRRGNALGIPGDVVARVVRRQAAPMRDPHSSRYHSR